MVAKRGQIQDPRGCYFAGAKGMNARARKKMTRRQQRAAFQASTATGDTAQQGAVTRGAMELPTSKMQGETNYDYDVRVYDMQLAMPQMFAAVVPQDIRDKGHAPVTEGEKNYRWFLWSVLATALLAIRFC